MEIIKCKVLDVREFKKKDNYYYHIILKDLINNKRFDLRFDYLDKRTYDEQTGKHYTIYGYEKLVNNDIIEITKDKEYNFMDIKILEESEA